MDIIKLLNLNFLQQKKESNLFIIYSKPAQQLLYKTEQMNIQWNFVFFLISYVLVIALWDSVCCWCVSGHIFLINTLCYVFLGIIENNIKSKKTLNCFSDSDEANIYLCKGLVDKFLIMFRCPFQDLWLSFMEMNIMSWYYD